MSEAMADNFRTTHQYMACTLDPLHIGTGEFQLGRVDNPILREAGTGLPKIPGTSLAGAARANTAMKTGNTSMGILPARAREATGERAHCGNSDCPVCIAFGFSKKTFSFQGLAQFSDGNLLFYPVPTLYGPMWMTSPDALEAAGIGTGLEASEFENVLAGGGNEPRVWTSNDVAVKGGHLNAGWLYFPTVASTPAGLRKPAEWTLVDGKPLKDHARLSPIAGRIVVVSDRFFSLIVEDQLEVRTTVSIDPATRAAATGALFTFEAVPRGAFFWFYLTVMEPGLFANPRPESGDLKFSRIELAQHVQRGLELAEWLGIGGSNTRGMGRTRIWPAAEVK